MPLAVKIGLEELCVKFRGREEPGVAAGVAV